MDEAGTSDRDKALGMDRPITRRDLLEGMLYTGAVALAGCTVLPGARDLGAHIPRDADRAHPPSWTGMRGSAPGTFENAHALRDGATLPVAEDTGERYDLVVVGAGLSGLAAAHFYRAQQPGARILLLDNHDDFGGHARRNEFDLGGRTQIVNGGTLGIDSPRPYSAAADGLLRELGVDVPALSKRVTDESFYESRGMSRATFLDRETFGADHLAVARGEQAWYHLPESVPLSPQVRADLLRLEDGREDHLAGVPPGERKRLLARMSYREYLLERVKVHPQVLSFYQSRTKGWFGVGIDAVSALDCWAIARGASKGEYPGFEGLGLSAEPVPELGYTPAGFLATGGSYSLHFPDGNATLARLLVRSLIPRVAPGSSVEDVVTARFDYSRLDEDRAPVRLRLASTVVRARNLEGGPPAVEVDYLRAGKAARVRARHCVLACYNMIIPYLCPELPARQKAALHDLVKTPLVYSSVAIRNRRAFETLGISQVEAPGCYHEAVWLNPMVRIGGYATTESADDPTLVLMARTPCMPGLPEKEQNRAGRADLLATSFETFERKIRDQLGRMLGPAGFDPARDITAITVNRWPHGYAPEFNSLFDPLVPEEERSHALGRKPFGNIAIANSDSGGGAYTDVAFDQAHRAVEELLHASHSHF
jgi:spermidine dehydrogenase